MIHDSDPVAEQLRLIHEVRRQHHGLTVLAQPLNRLPEPAAALGIESGGRLVQKDQARIIHQRQGQRETLALSA